MGRAASSELRVIVRIPGAGGNFKSLALLISAHIHPQDIDGIRSPTLVLELGQQVKFMRQFFGYLNHAWHRCFLMVPRRVTLLYAPQELIVFLVRTDPEPVEIVAHAKGHGSIRAPDINRPNFTFLLKRQRRVKWVLFEQQVLGIRKRLDISRKALVALPEFPYCERAKIHWPRRPSDIGFE
jgi:hypothetical protein